MPNQKRNKANRVMVRFDNPRHLAMLVFLMDHYGLQPKEVLLTCLESMAIAVKENSDQNKEKNNDTENG